MITKHISFQYPDEQQTNVNNTMTTLSFKFWVSESEEVKEFSNTNITKLSLLFLLFFLYEISNVPSPIFCATNFNKISPNYHLLHYWNLPNNGGILLWQMLWKVWSNKTPSFSDKSSMNAVVSLLSIRRSEKTLRHKKKERTHFIIIVL